MLSGDIASSGSRIVTCYPGFREAKLCCTCDQLRRTEEAQTRGDPLAIVGATMPPWPGEDEAMESKEVWHPHISTEKRYVPLCLCVRHAEWVAS
jgi:hypothetical protein